MLCLRLGGDNSYLCLEMGAETRKRSQGKILSQYYLNLLTQLVVYDNNIYILKGA